mmetsp:Transcript_61293/g.169928  ORF Transcript_61293/g.169928 Transcript_61293/m.169928 type:complete len:115 (-) Transcript_61293:124-468(-)|eukprot:CAMPEP_0179087284 /NCGR_PEP_ID=MMETSP0796-20121207/39649_1 /TAXON_ID=73915 /ORGANISM="Pyrodinium bahamense, Strain pbaha01" /LENGTH=114 /DNA_ID=CAMNT_0020784787 /DNA_START=88 /DNA_END=432 /DNA_ORIENTATION=+
MSFPEPSKELILQFLTNVYEHMAANPKDKQLILELVEAGEEGSAPHLEEIVKRRVEEKPDSQLAPYNSKEGAWFLKRSIDKLKATDAEVLEAANKFATFDSGIAGMVNKLDPPA